MFLHPIKYTNPVGAIHQISADLLIFTPPHQLPDSSHGFFRRRTAAARSSSEAPRKPESRTRPQPTTPGQDHPGQPADTGHGGRGPLVAATAQLGAAAPRAAGRQGRRLAAGVGRVRAGHAGRDQEGERGRARGGWRRGGGGGVRDMHGGVRGRERDAMRAQVPRRLHRTVARDARDLPGLPVPDARGRGSRREEWMGGRWRRRRRKRTGEEGRLDQLLRRETRQFERDRSSSSSSSSSSLLKGRSMSRVLSSC